MAEAGRAEGGRAGCRNVSPARHLSGLARTCWDLPRDEVTLLALWLPADRELHFSFSSGMLAVGWERGRGSGRPRLGVFRQPLGVLSRLHGW